MDMKRGKVLVGALVAMSLGSFAVPFAGASTGPLIGSRPTHNASRYVQLAQEEQSSEVEQKTERKDTTTMPGNTAVAPGTVVVAPANPAVVAPANPVVVPGTAAAMPDSESRHVESKNVEKNSSTDAMGNSSSEKQVNKSDTDVQSDGSVQQNEEHMTKEKSSSTND
jgi:hypothetical protein